MQQSNAGKLKAAVDAAIATTPDRAVGVLAAIVLKGEPDLIREMTPEWQREAVESVVRARLRRKLSADPGQMSFPFRDLTILIPIHEGEVEIRRATMGQLRECEKVLLKKARATIKNPRPNSMLGKIQRQIELMAPYVRGAQSYRKLTVEKVQQLVLSGVKPPVQKTDMSDAMKRYWETKAPEERSAIARRRRRKKLSKSLFD